LILQTGFFLWLRALLPHKPHQRLNHLFAALYRGCFGGDVDFKDGAEVWRLETLKKLRALMLA
jgi:hypothetical protein